MRIGVTALALLLLLVSQVGAATLLTEDDLDDVSAAGFSFSSPVITPVVITVPTTFINIPINVNTIIDTNIGVNTAVATCGFCPGTWGPTVTNVNPMNTTQTVTIPQVNTFTPVFNFTPTTVVATSAWSPQFALPTITVPQVSVPSVKLP